MGNRNIFLYANTPMVCFEGTYFCKYRNFIDFLCCLGQMSDEYQIIIPCRKATNSSVIRGHYPIRFAKKPIEVLGYDREAQAPFVSIINALKIRSIVVSAARKGEVIFCGPGPNSLPFYVSFILPRSVRYAFVIRGDALKTVSAVYKDSWIQPVAEWIVRLFTKRIVRLLRKGNALVFLIGGHLRRHYPGSAASVMEIAPLIEERFVRNTARQAIRTQGPLRFLYVGRLSSEKNILELIRALEMGSCQERLWELTIVGTGPLEAEVRQWSKKLNGLLRLKGHVSVESELMELYDTHDILCLPSLTEGAPRTVIEAFARGMPVLATAVGSLQRHFPEEIKFIRGFSAEGIREGMEWCDINRLDMSEMGEHGKQRIGEFFLRRNAAAVDHMIKKLIGKGWDGGVNGRNGL